MERNTKLIFGTVAASLAALGIVVVANTLSPAAPAACEPAAPAMTPADKVPSFHPAPSLPPPPPPTPHVAEPPRPLPAPVR